MEKSQSTLLMEDVVRMIIDHRNQIALLKAEQDLLKARILSIEQGHQSQIDLNDSKSDSIDSIDPHLYNY